MLCVVLATTAATARDIYVYAGDGKSVAHIDAQKLTFTSDAMTVVDQQGATKRVALADFDYFLLHGKTTTGVDNVAATKTAITSHGNMVTATSDAEIASMSVYSAMGTMVKAVKPNGPVATISLDDLDTGIYIVQVKTGATVVTKKIIKR